MLCQCVLRVSEEDSTTSPRCSPRVCVSVCIMIILTRTAADYPGYSVCVWSITSTRYVCPLAASSSPGCWSKLLFFCTQGMDASATETVVGGSSQQLPIEQISGWLVSVLRNSRVCKYFASCLAPPKNSHYYLIQQMCSCLAILF